MISFLTISTILSILLPASGFNSNFVGYNRKRFLVGLRSATESINSDEIKSRMDSQMEKLRKRDSSSKMLTKEDLKIEYEDDHIIIIDKPSGVLCVPGKENNPSLVQTVFEAFGCESGRPDKMVVHRLGMDTSGLMVFARTQAALSRMNVLFRSRKVMRKYEALLCGHVGIDEGVIKFPLMRDYEFPPYMRVSTDEHQRALIGLDVEVVGKKLLENPKESLTKYEVVSREQFNEYPVTRVALTSISGRTHQLNVHCAAFGHPIVGDKVYGINGDACPNGGFEEVTMDEIAPHRATLQLQEQIASVIGDKAMCVHAKSLSFEHPVTCKKISCESLAPF